MTDKTESEDDGNEDSIASNYDTSIYGEYDDSYLRSFRVKYSSKKKKSFGATVEKDWHISTKLSQAQIMALLYLCHELIKEKSRQLHRNQCMSKIKELSLNNPNWAEKCYLNDLCFRDIQSTMKATWRKRHKIEKDAKKQAQNRCRYKSFLADSQMYYSHYLQGKFEHQENFNTFHFSFSNKIFYFSKTLP